MNTERLNELQPAVDWDARQGGVVKRWLNRFESWSLAVERLVGRFVRDQNLNPLYHTGTITVFLLVLLLLTGIYLTLFYQFGFDATYVAVAGIESNPVGRIIRAVHRYASAATLITAVIHAWRTFFMDRFRGARWTAWVTGVASVSLVWLAGVTGYWMIWDVTAGPLNQSLIDLIDWVPGADAFIVNTLTPGFSGSGWVFLVLVITAHVLVSAIIGVMLWYHLRRLNRAHWLPPAHWMWVSGAVLLLAAIAMPVGMLPAMDVTERVGTLDLDLWFLTYLPAALRSPLLVWVAVATVTILGAAIPWLLRRRLPAPVVVDALRCTGCTLCFVDCPYTAITMGRQETGDLLAIVDPRKCVSCGICIGSCPPLAISFDGKPPETGWPLVHPEFREGAEVSYVCERHLQQGARDVSGIVIPVTCVGMIHPDEVEAVLFAGASRVRLIGCPPDDCSNREGNEWAQARLTGQRRPKAHEGLDLDRVEFDWRAPGNSPTVNAPVRFREVVPPPHWKRLLPVSMMIGLLVVGQLMLTFVRVDAFGDDSAVVEVSMKHRVGAAIEGSPAPAGAFGGSGTRLEVLIDGAVALDRSYGGSAVTVFEQVEVTPGWHEVLVVVDDGGLRQMLVFEESRIIEEREIISITVSDALGDADPERGEDLFRAAAIRGGAGCRVCHSVREGDDGVGPSLAGVGARAGDRVPGVPAEEYLRQSILQPDQYIVEGFPSGQMRADAGEDLTDIELADLVAYLLTLR
ncbi:MAG: hydrogenase iron-sulfur subunit [Acidimicrobiia bacterium]|nr:hydrogenase iron-sulfur subunit [Acidimicrobiia bacterium]